MQLQQLRARWHVAVIAALGLALGFVGVRCAANGADAERFEEAADKYRRELRECRDSLWKAQGGEHTDG